MILSPAFAGLPPVGRGQRIGLFGGSFNPPHDGHRATSLLALKRLQLDRVWWLVSPGNPLKDRRGLPPIAQRIALAQRIAAHPRIAVTGFEATFGSFYTCDTVEALACRRPGVHFVWLMGADSFLNFHLWKHWRRIADTLPLGIIDRPGSTLRAGRALAATALRADRLRESDAPLLATSRPPAYVFLHGPRSGLSSSAIRASG